MHPAVIVLLVILGIIIYIYLIGLVIAYTHYPPGEPGEEVL